MDGDDATTDYLELKEFLARNPCVKPRTFSRWKQRGLIDFIQPGGPNTQILVPADALQRMEVRRGSREGFNAVGNKLSLSDIKPKAVRQPNWMKKPKQKQKRKDQNV